MGFITQLSNMIIAANGRDGVRLLESQRWNKYLHVVLKRTNKREEIAFQLLTRPSASASQDLDEDPLVQKAGPTKPDDIVAAEASTTPELREKAMKLKKKLLNMDDEVTHLPASKRRTITITQSMNPVYNDLIRKFEAAKRFAARMETLGRGDSTPTRHHIYL